MMKGPYKTSLRRVTCFIQITRTTRMPSTIVNDWIVTRSPSVSSTDTNERGDQLSAFSTASRFVIVRLNEAIAPV
jgi:hypothetical protein